MPAALNLTPSSRVTQSRVMHLSPAPMKATPPAVLFSGDSLARARELMQRYDAEFAKLLADRTASPDAVHAAAMAFTEYMLPSFRMSALGAAGECEVCGNPKERADVTLCLECGTWDNSIPEQFDGCEVGL